MKHLMAELWEYLLSVNWDNEEDIEACLVKHAIPTIGFALLVVIGFALKLGFVGWGVGAFVYMAALMVLCGCLDEALKEKREEAFERAKEYNPPNVYGQVGFVEDEGLGDGHFR